MFVKFFFNYTLSLCLSCLKSALSSPLLAVLMCTYVRTVRLSFHAPCLKYFVLSAYNISFTVHTIRGVSVWIMLYRLWGGSCTDTKKTRLNRCVLSIIVYAVLRHNQSRVGLWSGGMVFEGELSFGRVDDIVGHLLVAAKVIARKFTGFAVNLQYHQKRLLRDVQEGIY